MDPVTPDHDDDRPPAIDMTEHRARQRSRNRVLGLILGSLAVLFFAITIVKLGLNGEAG